MAAVPNRDSAARSHFPLLGLAALLSLLNVSCGASAQPNRARQQEQGQTQPTVYFVRNPDPAPEFQLSGLTANRFLSPLRAGKSFCSISGRPGADLAALKFPTSSNCKNVTKTASRSSV
jgi:hypothetical protein